MKVRKHIKSVLLTVITVLMVLLTASVSLSVSASANEEASPAALVYVENVVPEAGEDNSNPSTAGDSTSALLLCSLITVLAGSWIAIGSRKKEKIKE